MSVVVVQQFAYDKRENDFAMIVFLIFQKACTHIGTERKNCDLFIYTQMYGLNLTWSLRVYGSDTVYTRSRILSKRHHHHRHPRFTRKMLKNKVYVRNWMKWKSKEAYIMIPSLLQRESSHHIWKIINLLQNPFKLVPKAWAFMKQL